MKRFLIFAIVLCLLFTCTGCSKYVSKYNAVGFVHSSDSKSAYMSFMSFEGSMVFRFKCTENSVIKYSAKLDTGSLTVYYDVGNEKTELCRVSAGDDMQLSGGNLTNGEVYIIAETSQKCEEGVLSFEIISL